MSNMKTIILAADDGEFMKSKKPKVLHRILGKSLIKYVLESAKNAGSSEVAVVVGDGAERLKGELSQYDIHFFVQEERLGTGHAIMCALEFINDEDNILVLYGDTPLIRPESIKNLLSYHESKKNEVSIISVKVSNPKGYGRIIRDIGGDFTKIVEDKDASERELRINEINTGVYIFKGSALRSALKSLKNDNSRGEYYLTDTLEILFKEGRTVRALVAEDFSDFYNVNTREQLSLAQKEMQRRINLKHMENGVTIWDSDTTYISPYTEIGRDTTILPGVMLLGDTKIGEDCEIGPYSVLENVSVACGTTVKITHAKDAKIGSNSTSGPFAYIRPNSDIGNNTRIGDFVEIKNSVIGDGTKVSHLTYVGDSDVGENINFGCGTVTVNYDGKKKYRTIIEDNAFIGCNTNLIAPVKVEKDSYIAAGSTITKDVSEGSLAVARSRQKNILGWKNKK